MDLLSQLCTLSSQGSTITNGGVTNTPSVYATALPCQCLPIRGQVYGFANSLVAQSSHYAIFPRFFGSVDLKDELNNGDLLTLVGSDVNGLTESGEIFNVDSWLLFTGIDDCFIKLLLSKQPQ